MRALEHFLDAQNVLADFISNPENFERIEQAIDRITQSFNTGGKIIACGNGGSHCDAMHFAEELTGRYRHDRRALPALAISDSSHITCVANDYGYEYVFSRFIEAHGKAGDVLLGISTSGNSPNVIKALEKARELGMYTIALTGKDGGKIKDLCDLEIRAPKSEYADRAQEIHIKIIHSLIDGIELRMQLTK
jgi:D-sedoheptulose 7-phosphate isomerase